MTVTDIGINPPDDTVEEGGSEEHRPLLEVWRELFKPAQVHRHEPVGLQWAVRLKETYPHLTFAQLDEVRKAYFDKLNQLIDILHYEIESDALSLTRRTLEEDATENAHHYKSLLLLWQQCFLLWESEWAATSDTADIDAAVIAEVHKMVFGPMGIVAHLDSINFEFTESDQRDLGDSLQEFDDSLNASTGE